MLGNQIYAQVNANFSASEVYVCAGSTVQFTNLSTGATASSWFENGVIFSSQTNPSRSFTVPGAYTISLIASNGVNADTANTLVIVNPVATSSIAVSDASCFGFSDGALDLTVNGGTPKGALCFDGVDDFVAADEVGAFSYAGGLTIEAWVKPDANWTSGDGMVAAFNTQAGGNQLLFSYNTTQQRFLYFDGTVGNQPQNGLIAPRGQWHHVAITLNPTNNAGRMYVNGILVRSFVTGTSWIPNNSRFSIGQEYDGLTATSQHFNGCIGEVRVWNAALTATTITDNFNNICAFVPSTHPNINNLVAYYSFNEGAGNFVFDRSGNDNHGTYNGNTWAQLSDVTYSCFSQGTGYAYGWNTADITEDLSGLSAGTYQVTITDGANCVITDSATVNEPPQINFSLSASPSDTLCVGDTVSILTSGSYTFNYSPSGSLSSSTGATVSAFPSSTTTYTVIATDAQNCADTSDITLVVNSLPTPGITGDDTLCVGDTASLSASGGVAYQWNTGDNTAGISTSPGADSTYSVLVTDANGCQASTSFEVVVNPLPQVGVTFPQPICLGDTATFSATGGISYQWSNNDTSATISVSPPQSTTYTVVVTDGNGCQGSDSVPVVVNPLPTIAFIGNRDICEGDTATITASGGIFYAWDTGDSVATINVSPLVNTSYIVVVADTNGCQNQDTFSIEVNGLPTVTVSGGDTICPGIAVTLSAAGASSYDWSTMDTSANVVVSPTVTTDYTVTGTDTNGCQASATTTVNVLDAPTLSFSGDFGVCPGISNMLTVSGADSYVWNTTDTTPTIMDNLSATFTYIVTGTDSNGCVSTDSATVVVFPTPTNPLVTQNGALLVAASGYATYQWFFGGSAIAGATDSIYQPVQNGAHTVVVTDSNGCEASTTVDGIVGRWEASLLGYLEIYPNPNAGQFSLALELASGRDLEIRVLNLLGQVLHTEQAKASAGRWTYEMDLHGLAEGVYMLEVRTGDQRAVRKLIVE